MGSIQQEGRLEFFFFLSLMMISKYTLEMLSKQRFMNSLKNKNEISDKDTDTAHYCNNLDT